MAPNSYRLTCTVPAERVGAVLNALSGEATGLILEFDRGRASPSPRPSPPIRQKRKNAIRRRDGNPCRGQGQRGRARQHSREPDGAGLQPVELLLSAAHPA